MSSAKSKKKPRVSEFEKKIQDSGEIIYNLIERHKSYAKRASIALSSMLVAVFSAYWSHFSSLNQNNVNIKVIELVEDISKVDKKITDANKKKPKTLILDKISNESLEEILDEKDRKEQLLSKILLIYKENSYLLKENTVGLHYHIQIYLIIISVWIIIFILSVVYFYHMKEIAQLDKLRLAYDRILVIYKLKSENAQTEISKILKSNDFLQSYQKPLEISFFPKFLSDRFRK